MSIEKKHIKELLVTFLQYILTIRLLSQFIGFLSHCEHETRKNLMIKRFGKYYKVNTKEAVSRNLKHYRSFNDFFTRQLKPGVRTVTELKYGIACPVDGVVSQAGTIAEGEIFQAKGKKFTVTALLGGDSKRAELFSSGVFATIYLSPKDYHRVHMPMDGTLKETIYVPGRLFCFNKTIIDLLPEVYARNERVISLFDTSSGPMALVLVGSIFSSSIETVWDGVIKPSPKSEIRHWNYPFNPPTAKKGEEMGRFNMGSTVIVLFGNNKVKWEANLEPGSRIQMGELIGKTIF